MAYLGEKKGYLEKMAPNHPFAHSQISFGVKPPASSSGASQTPKAEDSSISQNLPASATDSTPND